MACSPGRCKWPEPGTITTREYHGSPSNFTETVVRVGSVCERDGVCWKVERDRIRAEWERERMERHEELREVRREQAA